MKKIIMLIATMLIGVFCLTGCSDPVADEFQKFLNEDMVKVNANYDAIKAEAGTWDKLESNEDMKKSLTDVMLPNVNESLDLLSKINVETDEVKEIKGKYQKVLETYKEGFEILLPACDTDDADEIAKAQEKIEEAIKLLDEYNQALEKLAKEKDMKIEY